MLTHGGFPENEALHWNDDTYQQFGEIVFLLSSGKSENRQKGYQGYYELRRRFMANEFDSKMEELDKFRAQRNARPIQDILWEIGSEITIEKKPRETVPVPVIMPTLSDFTSASEVVEPECVQLSLF